MSPFPTRRLPSSGIERIFEATVRRHGMIRPGDRVLAAVSGGGDSVLLLHFLLRHRAQCPFVLEVAHLNHQLRGEESEADERFVRDLAARQGLACEVGRADPGRSRGESSSIEERARRARRRFLRKTAQSRGCRVIALGHTLDDQVETMLMWLLRGTGRGGLSGMQPVTRDGIVRPLIQVRRKAVRDLLGRWGEPYREDSTNLDSARTRNRLRLEILPALERAFPGSAGTMAATAGILAAEDAYLDRRARGRLDKSGIGLTVELLNKTPRALARRMIRLAARRADTVLVLERDHVEAILALARHPREGRTVDLPGGAWVSRRGDRVVFGKKERRTGARAPGKGTRKESPAPKRGPGEA